MPAPGSECTEGAAQPGGLCHEIVEVPIGEATISATDVFDVDGDARLDIVLVGNGWVGSALSVVGAWPRPFASSSLPAQFGPVAVGDLDDDGVADMVAGRSPVTLLRGAGDGGFSGRIGSAVPAPLRDALAIDVNADGLDDLVTLHDDGSISSLRSRGGGTLATDWVRSAGCLDPLAMVGGEFSGDGVVDLAVGTDDNVTLLLGDGSGGFAPGPGLDGVGTASAMAAADFDGDGLAELAVADPDLALARVLDVADGELVHVATVALDATPSAVAAGDLQADGRPDLVVGYGDEKLVTWAWGVGDGTFEDAASIASPTETEQLVVSDLDGDGFADAMIADASGVLSTFLGGASGELDAVGIVFADVLHEDSALADLDGDGLAERVSVTPSRYAVAAGVPGGDFAVPQYESFPERHDDMRFVLRARLDDDDTPDILIAGDTITTAALLGDGAGGLTTASAASAAYADLGEISVGDFDQDGRSDFVMNGTDDLTVWEADGSGDLQAGALIAPLSVFPTPHAVGDLDGDGDDDFVWVPPADPSVYAVLGDGAGAFGPILASDMGADTTGVVLADFDEDGQLDLVTEAGDHIVLAAGAGDGTFAAPANLLLTHSRPMVADFNGDGHLDVAGYAWLDSAVRVALGAGDGTVAPATTYATEPLHIYPRTADFNGDGLADALLRAELSTLRLLMSNPCGCAG